MYSAECRMRERLEGLISMVRSQEAFKHSQNQDQWCAQQIRDYDKMINSYVEALAREAQQDWDARYHPLTR